MNIKKWFFCILLLPYFVFIVGCNTDVSHLDQESITKSVNYSGGEGDIEGTVTIGNEIHTYWITFKYEENPDSIFTPDFAFISFELSSTLYPGIELFNVHISKPDESNTAIFDIRDFASNYLENGNIDGEYTDAEKVFAAITNPQGITNLVQKDPKTNEEIYTLRPSTTWKSNCTCWFWETSLNGVVIESEFLGCTCACDDPNLAISCGGSTGGGGGPSVNNNDLTPPDCESFPYTINAAYTHRITGAHNVFLQYWTFAWFTPNAPFEFAHHLYMFNEILYFTAPLGISNGEAANLTAAALSAVADRMEENFGHEGLTTGNSGALQNFILAALNDEMSAWGGSASLQSNGVSNNNIGIYNETWLPTTCN